MTRRRKHLSKAHRAAISRGLKRYWHEKKKRIRVVARREKKFRARAAAAVAPIVELGEWEATVKYSDADSGKPIDITIRVLGPVFDPETGFETTNETIRKVVWRRAHGTRLTVFSVQGIVWQSGRGEYTYPSLRVSLTEAFENMRGILHTIGLRGIRIARVDQ